MIGLNVKNVCLELTGSIFRQSLKVIAIQMDVDHSILMVCSRSPRHMPKNQLTFSQNIQLLSLQGEL